MLVVLAFALALLATAWMVWTLVVTLRPREEEHFGPKTCTLHRVGGSFTKAFCTPAPVPTGRPPLTCLGVPLPAKTGQQCAAEMAFLQALHRLMILQVPLICTKLKTSPMDVLVPDEEDKGGCAQVKCNKQKKKKKKTNKKKKKRHESDDEAEEEAEEEKSSPWGDIAELCCDQIRQNEMVGKFQAAFCSLERWNDPSCIVGITVSRDEAADSLLVQLLGVGVMNLLAKIQSYFKDEQGKEEAMANGMLCSDAESMYLADIDRTPSLPPKEKEALVAFVRAGIRLACDGGGRVDSMTFDANIAKALERCFSTYS